MLNIHPITVEATAVCKGIELTHGNSFHYLTFELDSGERVYFQVSMKCYMMIVEGDRCLITYKNHRNSSKKKLKSFERIVRTAPALTPEQVAEVLTQEPHELNMSAQESYGLERSVQEIEEVEEFEEPKSRQQKRRKK